MQYTTLGRHGPAGLPASVWAPAGPPAWDGRGTPRSTTWTASSAAPSTWASTSSTRPAPTAPRTPSAGRCKVAAAAEVIVATKVWLFDADDGENPLRKPHTDPRLVIDSVEASLRDLRRDRIDLFQYHGVPLASLDTFVERLLPVGRASAASRARCGSSGSRSSPCSTTPRRWPPGPAPRACGTRSWSSTGSSTRPAHTCAFPPARANGAGVICMERRPRRPGLSEEALGRTLEKLDAGAPDDLRFLLGEPPGTWAELAFRFAAACEEIDVVLVGTGGPRTPRGRRPGHHRAVAAAGAPAVVAGPLRGLPRRGPVAGVKRLAQAKRRGWKKAGSWKEGSASSMGAQVPQWGWEVCPPHL